MGEEGGRRRRRYLCRNRTRSGFVVWVTLTLSNSTYYKKLRHLLAWLSCQSYQCIKTPFFNHLHTCLSAQKVFRTCPSLFPSCEALSSCSPHRIFSLTYWELPTAVCTSFLPLTLALSAPSISPWEWKKDKRWRERERERAHTSTQRWETNNLSMYGVPSIFLAPMYDID